MFYRLSTVVPKYPGLAPLKRKVSSEQPPKTLNSSLFDKMNAQILKYVIARNSEGNSTSLGKSTHRRRKTSQKTRLLQISAVLEDISKILPSQYTNKITPDESRVMVKGGPSLRRGIVIMSQQERNDLIDLGNYLLFLYIKLISKYVFSSSILKVAHPRKYAPPQYI